MESVDVSCDLFDFSCERLDSVEHEPTRKHQLSSHLPLKKNRLPPWQKNLEVGGALCSTLGGHVAWFADGLWFAS